MTVKYKPGDTVYIIESVRFIRKCVVLKYSGGLYFNTTHFPDSGGGIKLRENRLFPTEEDAKKNIR